MSDSDEPHDPSWLLEQSNRSVPSPMWRKQASKPPANKRDRKLSAPATKSPTTESASNSTSSKALKPHPFAQHSNRNDFLVYTPPIVTSSVSPLLAGEDQDIRAPLSLTSNPSGKRSLDEIDPTSTSMTIAPSDPGLIPDSSYSHPTHDVSFQHSSKTISKLRAEGLPDFLIRHYALLTVTFRPSSFSSHTTHLRRDQPFALFWGFSILCTSPELRQAYRHVLDPQATDRLYDAVQQVEAHLDFVLTAMEGMGSQLSSTIRGSLLTYIGHFRAFMDTPLKFPLSSCPSLPHSTFSRILSRNLHFQTILVFFSACSTPISLITESEGAMHLLPSLVDSHQDTHVVVSNTPPFPTIGCTTYDYARLGHLPLCMVGADGSLKFLPQEEASLLLASGVSDTLREEQLYCNTSDPPAQYRDLFQAAFDSLPADPAIFSYDYISNSLQTARMQVSYSDVPPDIMHLLTSQLLSHCISASLVSYTHPLHEHHSLLRPYRPYVFPPIPSPSSRLLPLGPSTIHIQDTAGGQVGLISSTPDSSTSFPGPTGALLCLLSTLDTLRGRITAAAHIRSVFNLSQEGSRIALQSLGSRLASIPPASLAHTSSEQALLASALTSAPYTMESLGGLIDDLFYFFSCFDALPALFPHATMSQPHVVAVAFSPDPDTRIPEVLLLMYFLPGLNAPRIFRFPLPSDLSLEDSPKALPSGYLHSITLSITSSGQLLSRYAGLAFQGLIPSISRNTGRSHIPPAPPEDLSPATAPPEPPDPTPITLRPPPPEVVPPPRYIVPDLTARYAGLFIAGIPQRASLLYSLDNIWHPLVALGIHTLLPGDSDQARQMFIQTLLRPPITNAPWASSYSVTIPLSTPFSMDTLPSPFSTPISFAGRRDPGGMMNPTFTLTLLSAADMDLARPQNELFLFRGPYIASLLDGLDAISISIITSHFSDLFPHSSFLGLRDFISHRLPRGRKAAAHSAWEPTVMFYAPAEHHKQIIDTIRSTTLAAPISAPCFYRLVATCNPSSTSLLQVREPIMLSLAPHVRAEITLASHMQNIRILPHPDHGRLPSPYLYASIGDTDPTDVIRSIETLIATGTLSVPWRYFFIDYKRRLFNGVWLLPSLPSHQSHCLYIATDFIPDNLRLALGDLPLITLTPTNRHPILQPGNLDRTPLGVLTRALTAASGSSTPPLATAAYEHLNDPYTRTW